MDASAKNAVKESHPKVFKLFLERNLSAFKPCSLGLTPRKSTKRGGGIEVRLLNRHMIAQKGLYGAFEVFNLKESKQGLEIKPCNTEEATLLEEIVGGVYVLLKDGKIYDVDGHNFYSKPTPKNRVRLNIPRIQEVSPYDIGCIPATIPIFAVFEKGYLSIKDNPKFYGPREWKQIVTNRIVHRYKELLDGNTFHIYKKNPDCLSSIIKRYYSSDLYTVLLKHPKFMLPYPELREWWQFQKEYPNIHRDLKTLEIVSIESNTFIVKEHEISIPDDNRLNWFASALEHGSMTAKQERQFLSLLHTKKMHKHQ